MKFLALQLIKPLWLLCVLCGCFLQASALDREAFSITNYDLNVRIEPEQHRLGVRGRITLRNDTQSPQKLAVLQISSSLDWKSIKLGDKALQFVTQPLTSDIDHTGGLSEAIVTLPQAVAPKQTIELEIGYEGVIVLDATRLTRIGTPDDTAANSDWDQIDPNFTAVRGAGYVAWYPITTEVANLSDGDLFDVLGRWKAREAEATLTATLSSTINCTILFSGDPSNFVMNKDEGIATVAVFNVVRMGSDVPTFVLANYKKTEPAKGTTINFLPGKEPLAASYASALADIDPLPELHGPKEIQVAELPTASAAPFVTENLLLTPLRPLTAEDRLTLVYALAQRKAESPRSWVREGLAHFAQVMDIEHERGRKAALDYLNSHRALLAESESRTSGATTTAGDLASEVAVRSLTETTDDLYLQLKAMYVWSMLRDMLGDQELNLVLSSYQAAQDKDSSYVPQLFARYTQRDLTWFFDNWVYHDRGLPDFKIESVFPAKTATDTYMVTITVDNLGTAGAEVPVIVRSGGADVVKRIEVRAKSKATIRVESPARPTEIVVNDGSVPESDMTNNAFTVNAGSN
jgi:hypothetical protein